MKNSPTTALYLRSGRRLTPVSPRDASRIMDSMRRQAMVEGIHPDDVPRVDLHDSEGQPVGYVSWNGRVWMGDRGDRNAVLIHDPSEGAR